MYLSTASTISLLLSTVSIMCPAFTSHGIATASPVALQLRDLFARGGSSTAHTCDRYQGGGQVCNGKTNVNNCNDPVNNVCSQIAAAGVQQNKDQTCFNAQGSAPSDNCYAVTCVPQGQSLAYQDCVNGFQDIMADCIDPNGHGYKADRTGGSRNIHFDDNLIGSFVDKKLPAWTIYPLACKNTNIAAFVPGNMGYPPP